MRRIVVLALLLAGCAGSDDPQPPTPLQRELSELAETMELTHPELFTTCRARRSGRGGEAGERGSGADQG
jgi:hypothetical protein